MPFHTNKIEPSSSHTDSGHSSRSPINQSYSPSIVLNKCQSVSIYIKLSVWVKCTKQNTASLLICLLSSLCRLICVCLGRSSAWKSVGRKWWRHDIKNDDVMISLRHIHLKLCIRRQSLWMGNEALSSLSWYSGYELHFRQILEFWKKTWLNDLTRGRFLFVNFLYNNK